MAKIQINHLTFSYEADREPLFKDINLTLDTTWKLGFTGRNGRGKTTFCKLLLHALEYTGTITTNTKFEYFPYDISTEEQNTANIIKIFCPKIPEWKIKKELALLEIPKELLTHPFQTLSPGEKTKVQLMILFLKEHAFLLIDEPTNNLDKKGRQCVSNYLKQKEGFLLISHDRTFLDSCIDHILAINKTNLEIQKGNFSSWYQNKQRNDQYELEKNEQLKNSIRRLKSSSAEKANWSYQVEKTKFNSESKVDRGYIGHKAAKMMQLSKNLERRRQRDIKEKESLLKNIELTEKLKLTPLSFHTKQLLSLEKICIFYDQKTVCKNIDLTIEQGDRIVIEGKNGSGKSSILKLIMNYSIDYTGKKRQSPQLKISYVAQNTQNLKGSLHHYIEEYQIDVTKFKTILRKLDFTRAQFDKPLETYSDGQKKKIMLARSLCEEAHLYIWDEPLNFIDIFSRIQIETLLLEYKPTLLFVEHDQTFCEHIATKTISL